MALEPRQISAEEEENPGLKDMTRRFWVGLVITVPLPVLAMGGHISGVSIDAVIPPAIGIWIELVLATPVVLWCGRPFFLRAERLGRVEADSRLNRYLRSAALARMTSTKIRIPKTTCVHHITIMMPPLIIASFPSM